MKSLLCLLKTEIPIGSVWYHINDGDTKYTVAQITRGQVWFSVTGHKGTYPYKIEKLDYTNKNIFGTRPRGI